MQIGSICIYLSSGRDVIPKTLLITAYGGYITLYGLRSFAYLLLYYGAKSEVLDLVAAVFECEDGAWFSFESRSPEGERFFCLFCT